MNANAELGNCRVIQSGDMVKTEKQLIRSDLKGRNWSKVLGSDALKV